MVAVRALANKISVDDVARDGLVTVRGNGTITGVFQRAGALCLGWQQVTSERGASPFGDAARGCYGPPRVSRHFEIFSTLENVRFSAIYVCLAPRSRRFLRVSKTSGFDPERTLSAKSRFVGGADNTAISVPVISLLMTYDRQKPCRNVAVCSRRIAPAGNGGSRRHGRPPPDRPGCRNRDRRPSPGSSVRARPC